MTNIGGGTRIGGGSLANSLMRSLPQVDAEKIGLMGVSWGGVIASTVIGIDDRFAFAIPTYGCGNLADVDNWYGRALGRNAIYRQVWDPMLHLGRARVPVLWFSWPGDKHFPLDCLAACSSAAAGPQMMALVPGMRHGHQPAWYRPEGYAFADAVMKTGKPWCVQTESSLRDGTFRVSFSSAKPLDKATLVSTTDTGITGDRKWVETPADLEKKGNAWNVTASPPAGTTAWFVNVHNGELRASSFYVGVARAKGLRPLPRLGERRRSSSRRLSPFETWRRGCPGPGRIDCRPVCRRDRP